MDSGILKNVPRETLEGMLVDFAKNWIAHDGLWFQAAEQAFGIDTAFVFRMVDCRVQSARERKGMQLFPCKPVGLVEYSGFARAIDPRIETECIACPPDDEMRDFYCGWRFSIKDA